jgi:hypothetical protein
MRHGLVSVFILVAFIGGAAADGPRRAADNARPQLDGFGGPTIVIDLKMEADDLVISVGDGKHMVVKPRSELRGFLTVMHGAGKTQAVLGCDADQSYKSVLGVAEDLEAAGFDKITVTIRRKE